MKKQALYVILLVALLTGLSAHDARGQAKAQTAVMHTNVAPANDSLGLNVLFTVLDSNGQPLSKDAVKFEGEGQAQLFVEGSTPVAATVEESTMPLKIALVIDNSGSMIRRMEDVKKAAVNFVNKVPKNAELAVFAFSDEVAQVQGFTKSDQIAFVETAIKNIQARTDNKGNTCIYKAAAEAVRALQPGGEQAAQARPAVVLFTDGKNDEAGTGCGPITEEDVIRTARATEPILTQVHTIGLCAQNDCNAGINVAALERLAQRTVASSKVGKLEELDSLFGMILSALNSQWVAKANLKPQKGQNQVTFAFTARINEQSERVSLPAEFNSDRDYTAPPTKVAIADRTFDPDKNEYTLTLKVTNPQQVKQLTVILRDAKRDRVWKDAPESISETMEITVPADGLKDKTEFTIEVEAVDVNGTELRNDNGEWPSNKGMYQPQEQDKLNFEFAQFPEFSWDTGAFTIKLTGLDATNNTKLLYKGSISTENTPFMEIPEGVLNDGGAIVVALPADKLNKLRQDLSNAAQGKPYMVDLTVSDPTSGQTVRKDKATTVPPPPVVTFWQRITLALSNYIVLGSILAIVVVVAGAIIVTTMRTPKRTIPTPLYNEQTQMGVARTARQEASPPKPASPPKEASPRKEVQPTPSVSDKTEIGGAALEPELRIKVVATPEPSLNQGAVISRFPCVIGRENSSFLIAGDSKVSRQHAEIDVQGTQIIIKDLRSGNGTAFVVRDPNSPAGGFIEKKRLEKGGSAEWDHQSLIRLGPSTFLELKPQGLLQPSSPQTMMHNNYDYRTEIIG